MEEIFSKKNLRILVCFIISSLAAVLNVYGDIRTYELFGNIILRHSYIIFFLFVAFFILLYKTLFVSYKHRVLPWILAIYTSIIQELYYFEKIYDITRLNGYEPYAFFALGIINIFIYKSIYVALLLNVEKNLINLEEKPTKNVYKKFFIVLAIIYGLNYIAMLPGSIQYDSASMLEIAYGIRPLTMDNPLLQVGFMSLLKYVEKFVGSTIAIAIYTFIQNLLVVLLLSSVLYRVYRKSSKLSYIMLILFIILPPFMHYACSMGKDYPLALAMLYISILLYDLVESPSEYLSKATNIIKLCISFALVILLRNIGIYLISFLFVFLAIWLIIKQKKRAVVAIISLCISIVICYFGQNIVADTLNIQREKKSANKSVPLMQIARIYKYHGRKEFSDFEYNSINKLINLEKASECYEPGYADYVKDLFNESASHDEIINFNKAYFSLIKRNPGSAFFATYNNCYAYFVPGVVTQEKPIYFFENYNTKELSQFINPKDGNRLRKYSIKFTFLMEKLPHSFLKTTGFIQFIHFAAFIIILFSRKFKYLLVVLPSFLYAIGLIGSPINGYYRYCLPTLLCMGTSVLAMISALAKNDTEYIK